MAVDGKTISSVTASAAANPIDNDALLEKRTQFEETWGENANDCWG